MEGKVVATVYYEGSVFIFTEYGYVFEMVRDPITHQVQFRSHGRLPTAL